MLIDGQKWACEACIRGHRVSSCKHHDRPLIRIKRKGRPFATCSICNSTPCKSPTDHARQKRESELKHPKKASHARLYPRHHNPHGFLPIAPRPISGATKRDSGRVERSGSQSTTSADDSTNSHSNSNPNSNMNTERRNTGVTDPGETYAVGYWSGSEEGASGNESSGRTRSGAGLVAAGSTAATSQSDRPAQNLSSPVSRTGTTTSVMDPSVIGNTIFDPMYSLLPPSSVALTQSGSSLVSPLDGANPFDFPLDPSLAAGGTLGCLEDMDLDITEGLEEVFHVEDWSRYMWSPETGFEHLDMGYPPMTR
ncbi:hypothetical protein N7466_008539 [Penicillium verhagenii]|uniref:uncharacterized protein n=1 Tax=Penicillium verhagenii TaxID=1562060 RepID=UPI00254501E5|nr:uncharacterized protein N7466_008539 [Penicillium verhagenii]KAJ5924352.1 hypothetical protein N7466_008539 [Penicillium verhagenii]